MDLKRADKRLKMPSTWPIWVRRGFALSCPVSVPLWLLAILATGGAVGLARAWQPFAEFWNAPPKRLHSSHYGYSSRSERSAKLVELPRRERRRDAA